MPQQLSSTEDQKSTKLGNRHKPLWRRRLASVSRWLHIYLSTVSFGVVFFFSITGITLNHQDRFTSAQSTMQRKGHMNPAWVNAKQVEKLDVVEFLRRAHGIRGAVSDFRIEDKQAGVSFKGPGYAADAFVDRRTGNYELNETRMGWVAIVNDLHKGRDSGTSWSWVIDLSAGLLVLVSLTGVVLLCYLNKKRFTGFVVMFAGAAVCYVVYAVWVP